MQNYSAKIKNSTVSHGNCGHGLLYNRRELSTKRPSLDLARDDIIFMQNKANLRKSQVNVNLVITRDYEKKSNRTLGENKPNFSEDRRQMTEDRCQRTDDRDLTCPIQPL